MKCEECKTQDSTGSVIVNGRYYSNICSTCRLRLVHLEASSGHAEWKRRIDAEDHEGDIAQPWGKDGKPNPMFIRLYPDKAARLFTKEQMRQYG